LFSDKTVRIWHFSENGRTEECKGSPFRAHHYSVQQMVISPCSSYMATCSLDGMTVIWELNVTIYNNTYKQWFTNHARPPFFFNNLQLFNIFELYIFNVDIIFKLLIFFVLIKEMSSEDGIQTFVSQMKILLHFLL